MRRFTRRLRPQEGVTLLETIIAVGIMSVALTMVGSPLVGALMHDEEYRNDLSAITALQAAHARVSKDAINSETVTVDAGADPVDTATFAWEDLGGTPHSAIYAIADGDLVRTFDGANQTVARRVESIAFSRTTNVLTFTIVVYGATGTTDSKTSTMFLRSLE